MNFQTNIQPTPSVFNEGFSWYETISKLIYQINLLIDGVNLSDTDISDLKQKKLDLETYLDDIKNNRKLDEFGNFTGTWNGLAMHETEEGLATDYNDSKGTFVSLSARLSEIDKEIREMGISDFNINELSLDLNSWGYKGICVRNWKNSLTEGSQYSFDSDYYKNAISNAITTLGIDSVQIIPNTYQQNATALNVEYRTPITVNEVRNLIIYCKSLGLKVALCPHVESDTGEWRGTFIPSDTSAWFTSYKTMIEKWADLAEETKCNLFFVGSEYKTLTTNTYRSYWETIISSVRTKFNGILTYGANCSNAGSDEYDTLCFWDLLDTIGLDVYLIPTLTTSTPNADYEQLMYSNKDGQNLFYAINRLAKDYNKPLIFAEYGVDTTDDTYKSNYLESYLKSYGNLDFNRGMFLWSIDPLGVVNNWYPNGQTAQNTIKKYYSQKSKSNKVVLPDMYVTNTGSDTNTYWTKIATIKMVNNSATEGVISLIREQYNVTNKPTLTDLKFRAYVDGMTFGVNVDLSLSQNGFIHPNNITYVISQDDTSAKVVDIYIKIAQYVQYSYTLKTISKNKLVNLYSKQPLLSVLPSGTSGNPTGNFLLTGYVSGTTSNGLINEVVDLHFPTTGSTNPINISFVGASITSLSSGNTYDINLNAEIISTTQIKIVGKHLVDTTNRNYTIKWLVVGY